MKFLYFNYSIKFYLDIAEFHSTTVLLRLRQTCKNLLSSYDHIYNQDVFLLHLNCHSHKYRHGIVFLRGSRLFAAKKNPKENRPTS